MRALPRGGEPRKGSGYARSRMELGGPWRAARCDDEVRRIATGTDADDAAWPEVAVPGHWRSTPAFADSDGPLLYRTRFDVDVPGDGERCWLVFDGLFYQGDVWLDGAYLGDTEGYFVPHHFDITDAARRGDEHVLAVEATCTPPGDKRAKRAITGVFQHWDCMDPQWNPGGLWRPVRIERTGPVRITRLRVTCREADAARQVASLIVWAELDSPEAHTVLVRTRVGGHTEHVHTQPLAAGANELSWIVVIDRPRLWWPWALGDQPLEDVAVSVELVDGDGAAPDAGPSHERRLRTGLRTVSLDDWILSVNGERLFVKGANLAPTRMALAEATPGELARDVSLAREAGLDLVRVHAHITRDELYAAADEAGVLVWQDMPLQWGYARGIRRQAMRQAGHAVDLLGHHPSVALWCGHNEPFALDLGPGAPGPIVKARFAAGQELPSWNRTVLDRSVRRALRKADETRPVIAHSGVLPHLPQLDGTDSHLYFGWYHGDERELPGFAHALPRLVRFLGEFGAQAVPETAGFMQPERWPDLDWEQLEARHCLQRWVFDQRIPPERFESFEAWRSATQAYQATLVRHHVEALRRLKYRPTGGFCVFVLNDAAPGVTWSLLDHERVAKPAYSALTEACQPVIVVAERMDAIVRPGQAIALDVHVVNDLRRPLEAATVTGRLSWPGGEHTWRWGGTVDPDAVAYVGTPRFVVPNAIGRLVLDVDLASGDIAASNRYDAMITPR